MSEAPHTALHPSGLRGKTHRFVADDAMDYARSMITRMHAKYGRVTDKRCRDCAAFKRSIKIYTSGSCGAVTERDVCWRADWMACGLIDKARQLDVEIKAQHRDGRRPRVVPNADGK